MYLGKSHFNRAMRSLAKKTGLEWDGYTGKFTTEILPESNSFESRIDKLERTQDRTDPIAKCTHEDLNLLLDHLGLEIRDGKRIVKKRKSKK